METMIFKAMKSFFLPLVVVASCSLHVSAQSIFFDEPHAEDGALILKMHDGQEALFNAHGELVNMHPVFQMPMDERKSKGLTRGVSSNSSASYKQDGTDGPTFNLTYIDQVTATGQGFDHPEHGAARRASLEAAFAYFSSSLTNTGQADVEIRASFSASPNSNPFAFSGAYYFGSKGFNDPFPVRHITTGDDPQGSLPDGYIQFNFHDNMKFSYDVNGLPQADQFDFFTVALHEIMHLLGFSSYCNASGQSAASPNVFTSFDDHLLDFNKNPLLEVSGSGNSATVSQPSLNLLTNNQVWFQLGPGRVAPIFSPATFNGSSLSHFDNGRTEHGEYVMHPSLDRGVGLRHLHEDEVTVLESLGYSVNHSVATSMEDANVGPIRGSFSGLYPNPATSDYGIQIDIPELTTNEIIVIVYDMMGRESYSKVLLNQGSGPVTAIDPYHNLTPGMYIVVGSSNEELFNQKLVIK